MKLDYIARETFTNLRRNVTLTIAAIMTVAVSLALFGSTLLLNQGVDNVSARWKDGITLIAFLKSDITDEQRDAIETFIDEHPEVERWRYVDREESHAEAMRLFDRNEAMKQRLEANPELVPDSYRLTPTADDVDLMASMGEELAAMPGVLQVTDERESVQTVVGVSEFAQRAMLVVGIGLLVAALLLILNAIRMAMYARRREIEVMKLVGATNWFIRVPFMLEGVVQGVIGSALGISGIYGLNSLFENRLQPDDAVGLLSNFGVSGGELFTTSLLLFLGAILITAIASAVAVSFYVNV